LLDRHKDFNLLWHQRLFFLKTHDSLCRPQGRH
jgi:hypothetical protein